MEKKKETPWTTQKKMFKDGNPDLYRKFTWLTWKNMTEGERAMWTDFSEVARAPIPKEVIDFKRKVKAANEPEATFTTTADQPGGVLDIIEEEKDEIKAKLTERGIKFSHNSKLETLKKKLADADNTE